MAWAPCRSPAPALPSAHRFEPVLPSCAPDCTDNASYMIACASSFPPPISARRHHPRCTRRARPSCGPGSTCPSSPRGGPGVPARREAAILPRRQGKPPIVFLSFRLRASVTVPSFRLSECLSFSRTFLFLVHFFFVSVPSVRSGDSDSRVSSLVISLPFLLLTVCLPLCSWARTSRWPLRSTTSRPCRCPPPLPSSNA